MHGMLRSSVFVGITCCALMLGSTLAAFTQLQTGQLPVTLKLTAKGFVVSIRDDKNTDYVIFKVHHNFDIYSDSVVISEPTGDSWSFENLNGRPEAGDILFVWIGVQSRTVSYYRHDDFIIGDKEEYKSDAVCEPTETVVRNGRACKGQLIFEETFDGVTKLNTTRWEKEILMPLDAEFTVYDDRAENCFVKNGSLHIVPSVWLNDIRTGELDLGRKCTGFVEKECKRRPDGIIHNVLPPVVSARIRTRNFFSFKYGRIDIRAKLTHGDWLIPLILLEPLTNTYGSKDFASGRVHMACARGNDHLLTEKGDEIGGNTLYAGAVLAKDEELRDLSLQGLQSDSGTYSDDFHDYSLTWTSSRMTFSVDGVAFANLEGGFRDIYKPHVAYAASWEHGNVMAPFDQLFYITLGVSAGGHSDFPDNSQTGPESSRHIKPWMNNHPKAAYNFWKDRNTWKSTWNGQGMQVDYIRIYAL